MPATVAMIAAACPGTRIGERSGAGCGVRLELKLQNRRLRVVMTRDSDVFVPLGQRVLRSRTPIATRFSFLSISIPRPAPGRTASRPITTAAIARRSPRISIATSSPARPPKTAGFAGAAITCCARPHNSRSSGRMRFSTNPTEARLALTADYREKLAEEILRGIQGKAPLVVRAPASRIIRPRRKWNSSLSTLTWEREPILCACRRNGARDDLHTPRKKEIEQNKKKSTKTSEN